MSIGNCICRDAIRYNGQCNWLGTENEIIGNHPRPYYAALKGTWYSGTSGIAWFLAHLHSVTGDKCHRTTALGAIAQALQTTDKVQRGKLGFHSGLIGIAFSAIEVGRKLHKDNLVEQGFRLLHQLYELPETEYTLDVIDGCAGAIPAIIRLDGKNKDSILNELLRKMGDYLLKQSLTEEKGISWNTMPQGSVASLTGYAHGAGGISVGLLELYNHTQEEKYKNAALAGFAYEDSCFDAKQKNWPDFREDNTLQRHSGSRHCSSAWCHGAPGIGLSRFRAYELTQNEVFRQAGQIAVDTTMDFFSLKQMGNFSLCHGLFGNADLLLYASEITGDNTLIEKVKQTANEGIQKFERRKIPFPNGKQNGFNSPDMMLGMAGIGYAFLRIYDRVQFKSILIIH